MVLLYYRRHPDKKEPDDLLANRAFIKAFVHDQYFPVPDLLGVRKCAPIDFDDPQLELIPEAYLDSAYPNTDDVLRELDNGIRNAPAYLIQNNLATHALSFGRDTKHTICIKQNTAKPSKSPQFKMFKVTPPLFDTKRGDFHALSKLEPGSIPTVSRIEYNNGIEGYHAKPEDAILYPPFRLTVSTVTGDTFVQLSPFISTDNVLILSPNRQFSMTTLFFIQTMINMEKWRCSYGRQLYREKFSKTTIFLPINEQGDLDEEYMKNAVESCSYWGIVKPHIDSMSIQGETLDPTFRTTYV